MSQYQQRPQAQRPRPKQRQGGQYQRSARPAPQQGRGTQRAASGRGGGNGRNQGSKRGVLNLVLFAIILIAVMVFVVSFVGNCAGGGDEKQQAIEYVKSENTQQYANGGQECIGYRVSVPQDCTEEQMRKVFAEVVDGDGYPMHTVWFYSDSSLADGGDAYDVAMLEEQSVGAEPVFTKA